MALRVAVYRSPKTRSRVIAEAMSYGVRAVGDLPTVLESSSFRGAEHDVAVFYGMHGSLTHVYKSYQDVGKPVVFVDMGYWNRLKGGRNVGYHKITVNSRHPTEYFQRQKHSKRRFRETRINVSPRRFGRRVLVAGMSDKAAFHAGFKPNEWEIKTVETLLQNTDREIVYRPKPSWRGAVPIEGTTYSPKSEPLGAAMFNCHAVVTHHSNVAVDGLVSGLPAFCEEGVASVMGASDLSGIESPIFIDDRIQWLSDIAYCQWNVQEIHRGTPWRHLKDEGLIP